MGAARIMQHMELHKTKKLQKTSVDTTDNEKDHTNRVDDVVNDLFKPLSFGQKTS